MDDLFTPVLIRNGGFFTRGQALDLGCLDRDLACALRRGELVRLRHGAYTLAAQHQQRTTEERHAVLTRAAMAAQRGRVAAIGPSAAVLHGLSLHGCDLSMVHLVRLDRGAARNEAGVRHHVAGGSLPGELVDMGGCLATGLARTVWEVARLSSIEGGVVTADSALRREPALHDELCRLAVRLKQQPRARGAVMVIRAADGRAESAGESLSRMRFSRFGIPAPQLQFEVWNEFGELVARSDFGWEEFRHVGEFDGKIKYGRLLRPGESPTDAVIREKRREDQIRRCHLGMSRFTWSSIMPETLPRTTAELWNDLRTSRRLYAR